jgi:hypothetical protein
MEGIDIQIALRYAADDAARIRVLARELLRLNPDVMVSNSNAVTTILQSEVHSKAKSSLGPSPISSRAVSNAGGSRFYSR